ncbi:MAG: twin transmembrane helix small protein [Gammaproteobacteria bacterium]
MAELLVIAILIGILISLGSGLFYLVKGEGDSQRMVKALTWRIGLSVALFLLLMLMWATGVIQPHAVMPAG